MTLDFGSARRAAPHDSAHQSCFINSGMIGIFAGVARLFISPKSIPLLLGGIAAVALVGAVVWGWTTIVDLRRDKVEMTLQKENEDLQETIAAHNAFILRMENAQADFEQRVGAITTEMEGLNRRMSANAQRRQDSYNSIVPQTLPGQAVDTRVLEDHANTGMNTLFTDMVTLSQPKEAAQ